MFHSLGTIGIWPFGSRGNMSPSWLVATKRLLVLCTFVQFSFQAIQASRHNHILWQIYTLYNMHNFICPNHPKLSFGQAKNFKWCHLISKGRFSSHLIILVALGLELFHLHNVSYNVSNVLCKIPKCNVASDQVLHCLLLFDQCPFSEYTLLRFVLTCLSEAWL